MFASLYNLSVTVLVCVCLCISVCYSVSLCLPLYIYYSVSLCLPLCSVSALSLIKAFFINTQKGEVVTCSKLFTWQLPHHHTIFLDYLVIYLSVWRCEKSSQRWTSNLAMWMNGPLFSPVKLGHVTCDCDPMVHCFPLDQIWPCESMAHCFFSHHLPGPIVHQLLRSWLSEALFATCFFPIFHCLNRVDELKHTE